MKTHIKMAKTNAQKKCMSVENLQSSLLWCIKMWYRYSNNGPILKVFNQVKYVQHLTTPDTFSMSTRYHYHIAQCSAFTVHTLESKSSRRKRCILRLRAIFLFPHFWMVRASIKVVYNKHGSSSDSIK